MKQLSKHELNKLTAKELKERIPFQITVDNEVIAVVLPMKDIKLIQPPHHKVAFMSTVSPHRKVRELQLKELPLSKHRQAQNLLPRNY